MTPRNLQSSNPPFTSIELDHSDSGREGCTVTTLTVTAEPKNWQSAVKVAVQEVCMNNVFLKATEKSFNWFNIVSEILNL